MRVLLIKTSSMGDIIHTLPALTDALEAIPSLKFDWVIEDIFAEIPHLHPSVNKVIPVALRRWRNSIFSSETRREWRQLRKKMHEESYDLILDAQGLMKSAFLTFFARGLRAGLDWRSARESLASLAYQRTYQVNFYQHAVNRMRRLFSQALDYDLPGKGPDFGLQHESSDQKFAENYLVFLHCTTWTSKQWPESYWIELAELAQQAGLRVKLSGGTEAEIARATRIANSNASVDVLPRLSIAEMARLLVKAKGAVAVDTGFGHLAAALGVPIVSIYGSTNPEYTGALGKSSTHLVAHFPCAPCLNRICTYKEPTDLTPACLGTITPSRVWKRVRLKL